ncbi:MAG TPA: malectin domain-containing carbohydrate-binding protein [Ktedonobacteraceae bacterium]|jgi:hypothetical protein
MRLFVSKGKSSEGAHARRRSTRRIIPALIALLAVGGLVAISFAPLGSTPQARAATWTQIWSDEFNGAAGTGVDTSVWKYDTGTGFGTGEIETMTTSTSNVHQDGNGHALITALRDGSGNWTSGRFETQRDDFAAPAGGEMAVEASIQQPNVSGAAGEGYWPAFWMLGTPFRADGLWPKDGEVDILEDINGLSSVYGTLHCGVSPGGPCNETSGIGSGQRACSGCQSAFHTYRVELDRSVSPEQIRWFLDGNNYFTVNANQVDATTWTNAVDHAFFVIFDLAMGGGFPNGVAGHTTPTAATTSGASMLVDYVRVFTSPGSAPTPTPTPGNVNSYAINSGGPAAGSFQADAFFSGGTTATTTNAIDTSGVSSPAPQAVYQSERYGNVTYTFPGLHAANTYTVRLHFAEFFWSNTGQRVFNVSINGSQVLSNFDILAAAGAKNKAVVRQFSATANGSGQIIIQFSTVVDNAKSGGIEIIPGSAPTPTPTPPGCPSGSFLQGVVNSGASSALPWFQPCGWTAGYVILHYTRPGLSQQNVQMSFNSGTARWEFSVTGISAGQVLQYSFTYQKNGVQSDTGAFSWTHP